MKTLKLASVILMGGLLASCAMTNSDLALNYQQKNKINSRYLAKTSKVIRISNFRDDRGVSNPKLLFHKKNMYNQTTSGGYIAEKPITSIVQNAISSGLKQLHYRIGSNGQYILVGKISRIDLKTVMGMFKASVNTEIQLELKLLNQKGNLLWSDTFTGHSDVRTAWGGDQILRDSFGNSLNDVVNQLQTSDSFYAAANNN